MSSSRGRDGILRRVRCVTLRNEVSRGKIRAPLNVKSFLLRRERSQPWVSEEVFVGADQK